MLRLNPLFFDSVVFLRGHHKKIRYKLFFAEIFLIKSVFKQHFIKPSVIRHPVCTNTRKVADLILGDILGETRYYIYFFETIVSVVGKHSILKEKFSKLSNICHGICHHFFGIWLTYLTEV